METQDIRIRTIDKQLVNKMKVAALHKGVSLEEYVKELLAKVMHKKGR